MLSTTLPGTALQGWHPGELSVQMKLGYADAVQSHWRITENAMREQHRIFHTSNLHFIPITTSDSLGRPWASIVTGANGKIGFVKSPNANTLLINTRLWDGEPLLETVKALQDGNSQNNNTPERFLTAGVGIEYSTRRRNKFAGELVGATQVSDMDWQLHCHVTEALGNCPKYINVRDLVPCPPPNPQIAHRSLHMTAGEQLPKPVIDFITNSDTVYIGSVYKSDPSNAHKYPSHAGMNSRGGLPGFIRVMPSDKRTVVVPDYSGNRFLMSLGNIESSGLASMTFICFKTGDVLYLTGKAKVVVGQAAMKIMARQACVVTMETTGYTFVRDAMPVRQRPGTEVERSPYSPKIKYLVDEPQALVSTAGGHKAQLASARQLSKDLAVFTFKVATKSGVPPLKIRPGQAVVLDFMGWIGPPQYRHMANDSPESINDDRVRTWTVSSAHEGADATWFDMTMREMEGGVVTGALFSLLRQRRDVLWGQPMTFRDGTVESEVVGVTGDFYMKEGNVNMLLVAGGIGLTPFLSMFSALTQRGSKAKGKVTLALAARDADVMLGLTKESLRQLPRGVTVHIDLFTSQATTDETTFSGAENVTIKAHRGRIPASYWNTVSDEEVFICGPGGFGDSAVEGLRAAGVANSQIHREGFY